MKKITTKQKQLLKGKAHNLKPIVFIGNNGLTDNVIKEINRGLEDHELIKIRIQESDRDSRQALFTEICDKVSALPIQMIGSIGIIYRENEEENDN